MAFEAASRKGLKRRFLIEHIESSTAIGSSLYVFDDKSELVLQDEASTPSPHPKTRSFMITSEGIGGLNKQVEQLNKRLVRLIGQIRGRTLPPQIQRNGGILLYGPEGTGKTLLLDRLTHASWRRVIRIDQSVLSGTNSKNQVTLRNLFGDAIGQQPSLIIIDNLEVFAGAQQRDSIMGSMVSTLVAELDRLKNTQVLVVAATHSPNDIDKSLRTPGRFRYEIEVPIPDRQARVDILKAMHGTLSQSDPVAEAIGERTHGFVGQDLEALYNNALEHAVERFYQNEDWVTAINAGGRDSVNTITTLVNTIREPSGEPVDDEVIDVQASMEDYERALLDIRPSAMKEVFLETPKVYWSDIGGSANVQETLKEVVEWPLKFASHMEALNLTPQKGILLYGPPGCSKTLTAKAVATSSGLNFIAVKGAELTSMYVGESERAVREVFRKARAAAPSIIFFDEIDSIGSERDSAGTKGLNVLTTLLNEMDGIESLKGVLVLAATNKPEILDPALLRPGRFDSLIYISPPNENARKEILRIRTRSVPLADDVDLDHLAKETAGYSGAEVVEICLEAARATMRRRVKATERSSRDRRRVTIGMSPDGRVTSEGYDAEMAQNADLQVSSEDFEQALQHAVRRITEDMIKGFETWRDGLTK